VGNEQVDVLHDRNQVILNLYSPQAAPPRSFQTESGFEKWVKSFVG
jgi:hypothetical protein